MGNLDLHSPDPGPNQPRSRARTIVAISAGVVLALGTLLAVKEARDKPDFGIIPAAKDAARFAESKLEENTVETNPGEARKVFEKELYRRYQGGKNSSLNPMELRRRTSEEGEKFEAEYENALLGNARPRTRKEIREKTMNVRDAD